MSEGLEKQLSYEDYLSGYFNMHMEAFIGAYNNKSRMDYEQRDLQLCEEALNLVVYSECSDGRPIDGLLMHYGHFVFISGKIMYVILPYVDGELKCAFPESKDDKVMTPETIAEEVKQMRDEFHKNKRVVIYQVMFDTLDESLVYEGEFINEYGRATYNISMDVENSDEY